MDFYAIDNNRNAAMVCYQDLADVILITALPYHPRFLLNGYLGHN